ncbi:hypothetical protein [Actinokineospora sp. NBRC 105648]|uniref:hypothetical protein n=1 Tax=Actinokineospora sp. NBRC 105648 TaxID=3032206 RepID=UPI0024A48BA9|nr:hypothetical protein [Actinokineospora sp. NBRC 105648]GLZ36455.1 hypothetical protein Acsp05_00800 [Actinokineospora sp. NBRC 105648]
MIDALSDTLIWVALAAAVWALVLVVLNRPPLPGPKDGWAFFGLLALLELGLLAQAVVGLVQLATTDRDVAGLAFAGYLLGALLILPVAAYWSLAERTRWGTAVLVVGALALPVMVVRMHQVWTAVPGG